MPCPLEFPPFRERLTPLSVEAYHILGDRGLLPEKTELLDGVVVETMPKSPLHNHLVRCLAEMLRQFFGAGWLVQEEKPLQLGALSEPEPDVSVVRGHTADFVKTNPTSAVLVIEVALSSLAADELKAAIYAEASVPEYWIVRGEERCIEIQSSPQGATYLEKRMVAFGEDLKSQAAAGLSLDWGQLFPA